MKERMMSEFKREFLDNISVVVRDYGHYPETKINLEEASKELKAYYRTLYRPREEHFKEAIWLLRDYFKPNDVPVIYYLDGEKHKHMDSMVYLYKNGVFRGILFLTNGGKTTYVYNRKNIVVIPERPTVKQFMKGIREFRDYMKTL